MNCTQVVETIPAVTTISVTVTPTINTPDQCGKPSKGVMSPPAPRPRPIPPQGRDLSEMQPPDGPTGAGQVDAYRATISVS